MYAENTYRIGRSHPMGRNYLRVRGEYPPDNYPRGVNGELAPRTRRILFLNICTELVYGTTSAYAENTLRAFSMTARNWNYLRVRGEYTLALLMYPPVAELPPRTRRIPVLYLRIDAIFGTTSAYAENTDRVKAATDEHRNYLRVRGEYACPLGEHLESLELPPRARRIPGFHGFQRFACGTTSACAENT